MLTTWLPPTPPLCILPSDLFVGIYSILSLDSTSATIFTSGDHRRRRPRIFSRFLRILWSDFTAAQIGSNPLVHLSLERQREKRSYRRNETRALVPNRLFWRSRLDDNQRTLGGSKFECRTYYIETCVGWHTGGPSPFDFCLSVVLNLLRMGYLIMVVGYGVKRPTIMKNNVR